MTDPTAHVHAVPLVREVLLEVLEGSQRGPTLETWVARYEQHLRETRPEVAEAIRRWAIATEQARIRRELGESKVVVYSWNEARLLFLAIVNGEAQQ